MLSFDPRPEGQSQCNSSRTAFDRMGKHQRISCVLGADADLGRQLHTGEATGGERQSLPKERGWVGSTARELSCKLILEQTGLEDCADAYVAVARNSSMTGQNIQIGAYIQRVLPVVSDHHLDSGLMMLGRTG